MTEPDLTALTIEAMGKPITDPVALRLAAALGGKGFKSCTPNNNNIYSIKSGKRLGLEVGTSMNIPNRAFWPPRKQGRVWLTYVSHAYFYVNYRGALPEGFSFEMDDAALSARFPRHVEGVIRAIRFHLPPPREGLRLTAQLGNDGRASQLYCAVARERGFVSMFPDTPSATHVEDGFYVAWAALCGVMRAGRLSDETMDLLRQRRVTPLALLRDALGGIFWENDVELDCAGFCSAYKHRILTSPDVSLLDDVRRVFGESNYWRQWKTPPGPITEDSWADYDRIAPVFDERLAQWRRGELKSKEG